MAFEKEYERQELLDLVMDVGEILKDDRSIALFEKGRDVAAKLWEEVGMKSRLNGIDVSDPQRLFSGKEELTPEQE